jgi:O-antigen/teichoic acid export membrane protein
MEASSIDTRAATRKFNPMHNGLARIIGPAGSVRSQLISGGLGTIANKVANTLLSLVLTILLARILRPEGYGIYAYVFALVSLLATPAQLGLPMLVVRETARAHATGEWGLMRGLWRWSTSVAGAFSIALTILAATVAWTFLDRFSSVQITTFAFGLLFIPLSALGILRGAALQGLHKVVQGQLPERVLRPALFALLLIVGLYLFPKKPLNAAHAMALHALAASVAFIAGAWLLWRASPGPVAKAKPIYNSRLWISSTMPLTLIAGMQFLNQYTDILTLGIFMPAGEVGIYQVAVQGAALVCFGQQAVTMVVTPYFAHLQALGDSQRLQRVVTVSARIALVLALPVTLICVLFGKYILQAFYGLAYIPGYTAISILALGQLVNALTGSVVSLLTMTGHERDAARGITVSAITNVALNFILIPLFGMNGAAMATAISMILWNVLLRRAVRQRLGLESMAFKLSLRATARP